MAVLSSFNGLLFRVIFLLALAYFCFVDVNKILDNSYLMVFTEAMNLPSLILSKNSAQVGVFGILFLLSAVHDLVPLLENNDKHFGSIVPARLLIFFVLTALSYMWESNLYIHNNAVFTYCFIEVWTNFVIFGALREEKNLSIAKRHTSFTQEYEEEPEDVEFVMSSAQEIGEQNSTDE